MKYEVHAVEGAATPQFRRAPDINAVSDEIAAIYSSAAMRGGRIVAGHSLVCDYLLADGNEAGTSARIDYLFLVTELPDAAD